MMIHVGAPKNIKGQAERRTLSIAIGFDGMIIRSLEITGKTKTVNLPVGRLFQEREEQGAPAERVPHPWSTYPALRPLCSQIQAGHWVW
jgi:hypothetical protein